MLLSQFLTCCGTETMGSMCAKKPEDPDYSQHRIRSKSSKKQIHEEIQPLVDELPNQSKLHHDDIKDYEMISPEQSPKQRSRSPTPSSDDESKLLQEVIADTEHLNSDVSATPDYSSDDHTDAVDDAVTPISAHDNNYPIDKSNIQNEEHQQDEYKLPNDIIDMDPKYALPISVEETPHESLRIMDADDEEFAQKLRKKYANKLQKHNVQKMHFIERYIIGYKHIKKKKRMRTITNDIDFFFEMHEKFDVDNILKTTSSDTELNAWKQFVYGEDKCGHPIMYDLIGSGDCKIMKKVFLKKDETFGDSAMMHMFRFLRKVENYKIQNSIKYGVKIYQQIQILDMKGFTTDHLKGKNRKITKLMIETLTRMFPEGTYKMYIINTPWPFRAIWKVIKGFMDPITVSKTKVLSEDYLKEMVKDISIEMIPKEYGGKGVWEIQYGTIPKQYPVDVYHGLD